MTFIWLTFFLKLFSGLHSFKAILWVTFFQSYPLGYILLNLFFGLHFFQSYPLGYILLKLSFVDYYSSSLGLLLLLIIMLLSSDGYLVASLLLFISSRLNEVMNIFINNVVPLVVTSDKYSIFINRREILCYGNFPLSKSGGEIWNIYNKNVTANRKFDF